MLRLAEDQARRVLLRVAARASRAVVRVTTTVAVAAIVGSTSLVTDVNIRTGSVCSCGDCTNSDTTTSSKEVTNANTAPDSTPGMISGSVTLRKVAGAEAPRLAAARS